MRRQDLSRPKRWYVSLFYFFFPVWTSLEGIDITNVDFFRPRQRLAKSLYVPAVALFGSAHILYIIRNTAGSDFVLITYLKKKIFVFRTIWTGTRTPCIPPTRGSVVRLSIVELILYSNKYLIGDRNRLHKRYTYYYNDGKQIYRRRRCDVSITLYQVMFGQWSNIIILGILCGIPG